MGKVKTKERTVAPAMDLKGAPEALEHPPVVSGGQDQGLYLQFDRQDDSQIIQELKGEIIEELTYKYELDTKKGKMGVYGLSIAGINEICRGMTGIQRKVIRVDEIKRNDGMVWQAEARAVDIFTGNSSTRLYEQPKFFTPGHENKYAYQIAQSKALRNAVKDLIPQALVTAVLLAAKKGELAFNPETILSHRKKMLAAMPKEIKPDEIAGPLEPASPPPAINGLKVACVAVWKLWCARRRAAGGEEEGDAAALKKYLQNTYNIQSSKELAIEQISEVSQAIQDGKIDLLTGELDDIPF